MEVLTAPSVAFTLSMIICYLISFHCFVISFVVDITHELNHLIVIKISTKRDQTMFKERLCEIVQLHSDTKQLSGEEIQLKWIFFLK